jgi:hypothetical protein
MAAAYPIGHGLFCRVLENAYSIESFGVTRFTASFWGNQVRIYGNHTAEELKAFKAFICFVQNSGLELLVRAIEKKENK